MNGHATATGSIVGVVTAVPSRIVTNADCPDPAAADEAAKITGVHERRWVAPGQSSRTLCTDAARRLLAGLEWASVDVVVYVTQTPDNAIPADVYRIAADLGMPSSVACVQVNWSCSGYVYGLWLAMRLLQPGQRALLLVGDALSTIVDPGDRATAPLFGDAGSATALTGDGPVQHFHFGTDGSGADSLCTQGTRLHMDGADVFGFTLKRVQQLVADVAAHGEPNFYLMHQAQRFILLHLARKCGLRLDEVPRNVERFGNCSSVSIPLLMCDKFSDYLREYRMRWAMIGYGAGWAWCGASIDCAPMQVVELLEVA